MILESIMNIIYNIFDKLLIFHIPNLTDEVLGYFNQGFEYLIMGGSILANYTPLTYLLVLFGVVLALEIAVNLYHLIMWILKKIPFLGIE